MKIAPKRVFVCFVIISVVTLIYFRFLFQSRATIKSPTRPKHDIVFDLTEGRLVDVFSLMVNPKNCGTVEAQDLILAVGDIVDDLGTMPAVVVEVKRSPWTDEGKVMANSVGVCSTNSGKQHYELLFPAPREIGEYVVCIRAGGDAKFVTSAVFRVGKSNP